MAVMCGMFQPSGQPRREFVQRVAHQAAPWAVAAGLTLNMVGAAIHAADVRADNSHSAADVRLYAPSTATEMHPPPLNEQVVVLVSDSTGVSSISTRRSAIFSHAWPDDWRRQELAGQPGHPPRGRSRAGSSPTALTLEPCSMAPKDPVLGAGTGIRKACTDA